MKILLKTIPHAEQRYPTVGDWIIHKNGSITIPVSDMRNEDYAFLVAIHELIEVWLCRKRGISQLSVDIFDIEYERNRKEGDSSEPGNHPDAPYFKEHLFASEIEVLLAKQLGVNWAQYESTVESL